MRRSDKIAPSWAFVYSALNVQDMIIANQTNMDSIARTLTDDEDTLEKIASLREPGDWIRFATGLVGIVTVFRTVGQVWTLEDERRSRESHITLRAMMGFNEDDNAKSKRHHAH